MPRCETCKQEFAGDGARFCSRPVTPTSERVAPGRPEIPGAPSRPPAPAAPLSSCDGPSPGRPSDAASRAARTGGGRWARSRRIEGHRRRPRWALRKDSSRRHGVGAAGPHPARSGRSGECVRTVTPSSRRATSARAETDGVVVKGRRRPAPLPWRCSPTTMRGPAEYMRPCTLDVSRLRVGGQPPAVMAGRVVVAAGRMRSEERGA